jgi:hypothetical protein
VSRIEEVPELGPVVDAMKRGSKRSRLRLTVAVCPANHTLVEVFRGRNKHLYAVANVASIHSNRHLEVDDLDEEGYGLNSLGEEIVSASCRCNEQWQVTYDALLVAVTSGRRRFVVS